ncbi:MAG: hypothetical protein DRG30_11110 [Epsilonproteobacteria bacterium]|nr:MAG: hypothetical protein DRG30_11110 [Campylobacterota bacterium]
MNIKKIIRRYGGHKVPINQKREHKKIEILNFHNLLIENTYAADKASDKAQNKDEDSLKVVFIRDPYEYFNYFLYDFLIHKRSQLFTHDIISHLRSLNNEDFLAWFDSLRLIPFYCPQTYQFDISKSITIAMKKLEGFDYVVPYEEIDLFIEKVAPDIVVEREEIKKLKFSLDSQKGNRLTEKFVGKDLELHGRSQELWTLSKENDYKPLGLLLESRKSSKNLKNKTKSKRVKKSREMQDHKGISGGIRDSTIAGWVFHKEKKEAVTLRIYHNNRFLCMTKADKFRKDLIDNNIHPTGVCGFKVDFSKPIFKKGDKIEVKILPDNILLPLGPKVKEFLGL